MTVKKGVLRVMFEVEKMSGVGQDRITVAESLFSPDGDSLPLKGRQATDAPSKGAALSNPIACIKIMVLDQ